MDEKFRFPMRNCSGEISWAISEVDPGPYGDLLGDSNVINSGVTSGITDPGRKQSVCSDWVPMADLDGFLSPGG